MPLEVQIGITIPIVFQVVETLYIFDIKWIELFRPILIILVHVLNVLNKNLCHKPQITLFSGKAEKYGSETIVQLNAPIYYIT